MDTPEAGAGSARHYVVLGGAVLGFVLADCVHAVRSGVVPRPEMPVAIGLAAAGTLVLVAFMNTAMGPRVGWLAGAAYALVSIVPSDDWTPRVGTTGLTSLFVMGVAFLGSAPTDRSTVLTVVASAVVASVVRLVMLA